MPADLYTTGPIRFTSVARAVADAARGMARFIDVQALVSEAVQRGSCTLEQLAAELREGPAAGRRWYRMALREIGAGIRSGAEAQLKYLIDRSDLERPMYNADLFTLDGVFLGRPDAWFGRAGVAGEVDSREYHLAAKDYATTTQRHNRMEAAGIHMLHWLPSTLKAEPHRVIADLRAAIAAGNQRPALPITSHPARLTAAVPGATWSTARRTGLSGPTAHPPNVQASSSAGRGAGAPGRPAGPGGERLGAGRRSSAGSFFSSLA